MMPGTTQCHDLVVKRKIGAMAISPVPNIIILFLPILSARMPPGSWNRMLLPLWIVASNPTMVMGVFSSSIRYSVHHSCHRPLKIW